jgi:hypothetical protein
MKASIAFALFAASGAATAQGMEIHAVQDGPVTVPNESAFAAKLTAFVESATVDSTEYVDAEELWERSLSAPAFIHASCDPACEMQVLWKRTSVLGILFVVPSDDWPGPILLKTTEGVRAVTKYLPCPLAEVMIGSGLKLPNDNYKYLQGYCAQLRDGAPLR